MKKSPFRLKQQLSKAAALRKAARDLEYAKSPVRRWKKADAQKKRRSALRRGVNLAGKDYDHTKGKFVSVLKNRGNYGKGTNKL
jgi:hypothetical protein